MEAFEAIVWIGWCVKVILFKGKGNFAGLKTLPGDDAFYYENKNGKLIGLNLSHVDDFTIAGEAEFVSRIVKGIQERFTVSKVKEDKFRLQDLM